jgi:FkbM family methyltransferase
VNILNRKYSLWEFIPPILVSPIKKLRSLINLTPNNNAIAPIKPFISPSIGSYSQFNEDLLIDLLLASKNKGFYLDVGANDPTFNSNTKRFYDKGWSGISIEPGLDSFNKFCAIRTRDINLNIGVGPVNGTLTFYQIVGDSTLSSFNKTVAAKMASKFGLPLAETTIDVLRLNEVFEHYVQRKHVDFMSVDAEGLDLDILRSNNWERFRPSLIIVEIDNQYQEIIEYMNRCQYLLIYNNYHNGIFVDKLTTDKCLKSIASTG